MPPEIARLAGEMLTHPTTVSVAPPATTAERIDQRVVHVGRADKPDVLSKMLKEEPVERALVFTRTKHGADRVVRNLAKSGIAAEAIHGNKSQGQREKALAAFRSGRVVNLVATDIAARGIDVAGISHVINYDLPNIPETYVHRIGRTARAGAAGVAISLCSADEAPFLKSIERLINCRIPSNAAGPNEAAAPVEPTRSPRATRGRSQQRRPARSRSARSQYRGDNISAVAFLREPSRPATD